MGFYNPANPTWVDFAIQICAVGQRNTAASFATANGNHFPSDNDAIAWQQARELSAAGNPSPPATHLMVCELIRQDQKTALQNYGSSVPGGKVYFESEGWTIEAALADNNLDYVPDEE
jgi:hypothetical protein